jgi:hypothetical protein
MNLRQKILFASKEDGAKLKYTDSLVQATFMEALQTGLTGRLKGEMRQYLQDPELSDEELLENLTVVKHLEEKRLEKRGQKASVDQVQVAPPKNDELEELIKGMQVLQVNVAALQEAVHSRAAPIPEPRRPRRRDWGCPSCKQNGQGFNCSHCFRCGASDHLARQCPQRNQENSRRLPQGGAQ